uniref:Uncharacterized protein n=1 Tax=viral metagenome TaxID=1070528 RepID=A0A6C0EB88_9ZZZZ
MSAVIHFNPKCIENENFDVYDVIPNEETQKTIIKKINDESIVFDSKKFLKDGKYFQILTCNMIENIKKILMHIDYFNTEPSPNILYCLLNIFKPEKATNFKQESIDNFIDWFFSQKINWKNIFVETDEVFLDVASNVSFDVFRKMVSCAPKLNWIDILCCYTDEARLPELTKKIAFLVSSTKPLKILTKIFSAVEYAVNSKLIWLKRLHEECLTGKNYFSNEVFDYAMSVCYNEVIVEMVNNKYKIESTHLTSMLNNYDKSIMFTYRVIAFLNEFYYSLDFTKDQLIKFYEIYTCKFKKHSDRYIQKPTLNNYAIKDDIVNHMKELLLKNNKCEIELQYIFMRRLLPSYWQQPISSKDMPKMLIDCGKFSDDMVIYVILLLLKTPAKLILFLTKANFVSTPKILQIATTVGLEKNIIDILNSKVEKPKEEPKKKAIKKIVKNTEEKPKEKVIVSDTSDSESEEKTKKKVVKKAIKKKLAKNKN